MSKYNSFAFLTCALPSQVGNWVHMQPEVWNRSKNAPYMPFLFSTDIVRLVCQFFIAVPGIESSHCVLIPALQHSELFRALCAIPYIAVLGIGPRFVRLFSRCSTRNWRVGGSAKIFHLCAPCGSFRDSKPTFFRHFKELTLHQQALSVRWGFAKHYCRSMFVNFARNFFRGLESVLAHSPKMLFRKITP